MARAIFWESPQHIIVCHNVIQALRRLLPTDGGHFLFHMRQKTAHLILWVKRSMENEHEKLN